MKTYFIRSEGVFQESCYSPGSNTIEIKGKDRLNKKPKVVKIYYNKILCHRDKTSSNYPIIKTMAKKTVRQNKARKQERIIPKGISCKRRIRNKN